MFIKMLITKLTNDSFLQNEIQPENILWKSTDGKFLFARNTKRSVKYFNLLFTITSLI